MSFWKFQLTSVHLNDKSLFLHSQKWTIHTVQVLVLPKSFQMELSILVHSGEIDQVAYHRYNLQSTRKEFEGGTYFERGMGYKWVHTRPKNITFIIQV